MCTMAIAAKTKTGKGKRSVVFALFSHIFSLTPSGDPLRQKPTMNMPLERLYANTYPIKLRDPHGEKPSKSEAKTDNGGRRKN